MLIKVRFPFANDTEVNCDDSKDKYNETQKWKWQSLWSCQSLILMQYRQLSIT